MFMLLEMRPVDFMATLLTSKGALGSQCRDSTNGDIYVKRSTGWVKILTGGVTPVDALASVAVKNSAGTITRTLTETTPGVVNLAATDTIVANNDAVVLKNHAGTVSTGVAGLNSAGTLANVAAGVVSSVTAGT